VCVYSVFLLPCVQVAALRRADPSSKESYRLCKNDYETEEGTRTQQRALEPLMDESIHTGWSAREDIYQNIMNPEPRILLHL
jgi:hypothetical protein